MKLIRTLRGLLESVTMALWLRARRRQYPEVARGAAARVTIAHHSIYFGYDVDRARLGNRSRRYS